MEGDAGASRLNPPPMSMISRLRRRRPKIRQESDDATDETSPEVTAEDSSESEVGADPTSPEVTAEDLAAPEVEPVTEAEAASAAEDPETPEPEGDQVDAAAEDSVEVDAETAGAGRPPSRVGRGWLAGIAVRPLKTGVIGC